MRAATGRPAGTENVRIPFGFFIAAERALGAGAASEQRTVVQAPLLLACVGLGLLPLPLGGAALLALNLALICCHSRALVRTMLLFAPASGSKARICTVLSN